MSFFRRNVWRFVFGGVGLFLIAAILFPVYTRSRNDRQIQSCAANLKMIGMAMSQYSQDYNGKFPQVAVKSENYFGWADTMQPYIVSLQIYQCPSQNTGISNSDETPNPRAANYTDYWMNGYLSGMDVRKNRELPSTILCGDGNDGTDQTDARYNIKSLPQRWINDTRSPLYRHDEKACYLFADGHMKLLAHHQVFTKGGQDDYQFLPR